MKIKYLKLLFMLMNPVTLFAQTSSQGTAFPEGYYDTAGLVFIGIIALIFVAFLYYGTGEGKPAKVSGKKSLFAVRFFRKYVSGIIPIEKEGEILLQDDFDGIKELDNRVPPWFNYLFYGTILFGLYYLVDYHVLQTGKLQYAEYADEMNTARIEREQLAKSGAFITEETVTFTKEEAVIEKGKQIFQTHCIACHGTDGGGIVGPNLTDNYWIHGAGIKNVFKTIKYGVPAKGMISWQNQLNPVEIQDVANYVLSLQGTAPKNPKPPEGTPVNSQDTLKTLSLK